MVSPGGGAAVFCIFTGILCLLKGAHGFIEPIKMPEFLDDCYRMRTSNISINDIPSQEINIFCITQFLYATPNLRPQKPISNETLAYNDELTRRVLARLQRLKERHKRTKRQIFMPPGGGSGFPFPGIGFPGAGRPGPGGFPGGMGRSVRREVRDLSRREWRVLVSRINMLKRSPVGFGSNRYDALGEMHRVAVQNAHGGSAFLGWHRFFILQYEEALGVPLPYWDSRMDFYMDDPTTSILWGPEYFGSPRGEVITGPFANWATPQGVPLIRNCGSSGSLITDSMVEAVLSRTRHGEIVEPNANPMYSLEGHHNGPHVWVDGQMSAPLTAPEDPVFYFHHAFVDYIWSVFRRSLRRRGIDPSRDYPNSPNSLHNAFQPMFPFNLRNFQGYSNELEFAAVYAPPPRCPRCGGRGNLHCRGGRCVSVPGNPQTRAIVRPPRVPAISQGAKFQARLHDPRIRGDPIPNAPSPDSATRRKRSTSMLDAEHKYDNDSSQINKPYQNTFVLNGVSDIDLWAFVPVKIIFERPPHVNFKSYLVQNGTVNKDTDMFFPSKYNNLKPGDTFDVPLQHRKCHISGSGAAKVYVQTDGIDYSGRYKDYAVVDERMLISSSITYIGVKNPNNGASEFYMTAHDSCGRVCRPQCATNNGYQSCSGAFRITSDFPKMYGLSYEDAVKSIWLNGDNLLSESNLAEIPVIFVCQPLKSWPWYK